MSYDETMEAVANGEYLYKAYKNPYRKYVWIGLGVLSIATWIMIYRIIEFLVYQAHSHV